jgi:flagellar hook protein FlgE
MPKYSRLSYGTAEVSMSVQNIVSQFLSGQPLTTDGPASEASGAVVRADASTESEALEDYGTEARSNESTQEDLLPGQSGDTPKDSKDAANAKAQGNPSTSDKEIITVTDELGNKRKVEIDYSNKEAVKKAVLLANGARKWQAERDKALESTKKTQAELEQIRKDWATLDEAFQQGPEALFDLLSGKQGAFKDHLTKHQERQEFLKHASPEEIKALEAQERADRTARELEKIRKEQEEFRKQVMGEKEQAEERALEAKIHPVFDKYRFADKLGDAQDEHLFDKMLWTSALENLQQYEEQGQTITPELIDKEFRSVATTLRKRINVQAEKKAGKVVEQKKREAAENVQAKVMSGYKTGGTAQEARDLLNKGDLTSLLKGWGKYGGLFNGKK